MTAMAEKLDAKLNSLGANAASSLEKLVRDALEGNGGTNRYIPGLAVIAGLALAVHLTCLLVKSGGLVCMTILSEASGRRCRAISRVARA